MLKSREKLLCGLKQLESLEKNGISAIVNNKVSIAGRPDDPTKTHNNKRLLANLEKMKKETFDNSNSNSNSDEIDTEFDEMIIPIDDDVFDKKEININVFNNVSMISNFPNALLLEDSIFSKSNKNINPEVKVQPKNEESKINNKSESENIWDILDKIKKENNSESLDTLTTDSGSEMITNCEEKEERDEKVCQGCHSKNTFIEDQRSSMIICSNCGMINEELLDHGPEWRQYYNDDNRGEGVNRCGCPYNFFFPKSSQGTIMVGSSNSRLKRKQKWNSMVYKERSLNQIFEYISKICSKNNITRIIVDSAKIFYKKLSDCKHKSGVNIGKQIIIRGENRLSIIAACVFRACEMNKNPRNIKEIAAMFNLDEKKVTRGNKQFDKIMKNADDNLMLDEFSSDTAEDFIRRHCAKLKVSKSDTDLAVRISQNCCKMKLASDHNPQSLAAGSILVMVQYCRLNIDKKNIATLFGTSDATISKIYNKIAPFADALIDDNLTKHLIKKFHING